MYYYQTLLNLMTSVESSAAMEEYKEAFYDPDDADASITDVIPFYNNNGLANRFQRFVTTASSSPALSLTLSLSLVSLSLSRLSLSLQLSLSLSPSR